MTWPDEQVLPYRSGRGAWIGKGPTKLSWSTLGEVRIDDGILSLIGLRKEIARCRVTDVSVKAVPIWFGMGVRLDMGELGNWYVQPRWSNLKTGRRATREFRRALAEAQSL
jgi:hypothetical protein